LILTDNKDIEAMLEKYKRTSSMAVLLRKEVNCCGARKSKGGVVETLCRTYRCKECKTCAEAPQSPVDERLIIATNKLTENPKETEIDKESCWECNAGYQLCSEYGDKGMVQGKEAIEAPELCTNCGGSGMSTEMQVRGRKLKFRHCL
jgi:hypothetical protein